MSKPKTLTREEYEAKMLKHLNQVRRLMKRFNPEACHLSMCITDNYLWAVTFSPDLNRGEESQIISNWTYKHTESDGIAPYFESKEIPNEQ